MAKLTIIEKKKLENLLRMGSGYVLDFSNSSFADFFREEIGINIYDQKYSHRGDSKANHLRCFWNVDGEETVGKAIEKLIDYAEFMLDNNDELTEKEKALIADCRGIARALTGQVERTDTPKSKDDFLASDFGEVNFEKLPVESHIHPILRERIDEAQICVQNGANLAAIFMAGSMLEGVLLGAAQKYPKQFNESQSCPKDEKEKPKSFDKWTLAQFIDAGKEIGILGEDVKKFSHALRDFRNYIHPYQQMAADFRPDEDTAKICLHVLIAALSDLIKNKPDA